MKIAKKGLCHVKPGKIKNIFDIIHLLRIFRNLWKPLFIIFKGLSVAKNCLRLESASLNYISYLHKVVLLGFYGFLCKGWNIRRLNDIFCKYSIKRMKELLYWLLYQIDCRSTRKIVHIPQTYMNWNSDKHKMLHLPFVNFFLLP